MKFKSTFDWENKTKIILYLKAQEDHCGQIFYSRRTPVCDCMVNDIKKIEKARSCYFLIPSSVTEVALEQTTLSAPKMGLAG